MNASSQERLNWRPQLLAQGPEREVDLGFLTQHPEYTLGDGLRVLKLWLGAQWCPLPHIHRRTV